MRPLIGVLTIDNTVFNRAGRRSSSTGSRRPRNWRPAESWPQRDHHGRAESRAVAPESVVQESALAKFKPGMGGRRAGGASRQKPGEAGGDRVCPCRAEDEATVLVAFDEAKKIGLEIPADLRKRGLDSIHRQRMNDHSYLYGEYLKYMPVLPINRVGGSLGRSQACNLVLRLWGDTNITQTVITNPTLELDWQDRSAISFRNGHATEQRVFSIARRARRDNLGGWLLVPRFRSPR
jgi:hypothetical protein